MREPFAASQLITERDIQRARRGIDAQPILVDPDLNASSVQETQKFDISQFPHVHSIEGVSQSVSTLVQLA